MHSLLHVRQLGFFVALTAVIAVRASAQSPTDAVTPGASRTYSTIYSIGIEWDVTNDTDHDAIANVEFRVQGTTAWRPSLSLLRTDYNGINRLAGSILFLTPNTPYEVRVSLSDPDGGGATRTGVIRTRPVPAAPTGIIRHVVPGSGGGDGSLGTPFRGVAAAQAAAQPGDTLVLHAGSYAGPTGGPVVFDKPGTSAAYIAWRAAGDGEVLMNGVNVAASHLWLEGITVRRIQGRTQALVSVNSPTNVVVTQCSFVDNLHAIVLSGAGTNWYIADNTIVGTTPAGTTGSASFTGEGVDLRTTSGHTVAYNSITNVADGISEPHTNVDIFANDIFDTADDGIEGDNGRANVRMWGNRIHNAAHNGISFQRQVAGPWYIIRNQIVSNEEAPFKFREDTQAGVVFTDRFVLLHNTIVNWGRGYPGFSMICCNEYHLMFALSRNNLWISVQGGEIWGFESHVRDWRADLDYDAFDWGTGAVAPPFTYAGVPHSDLSSFATASGLETHGLRVDHSTCFEDFRVLGPSPQSVPPHRMTLQAGCPAVDAGAVLPGINDGYVGGGPDMGAHERGSAAVAYGPRPRGTALPADPSFLRAAAASGAIGIQWTDNSNNEDGFRVERSTDGTTFGVLVTVGPNSIAYNDTTVSAGVQYHYRVAAYNGAGLSGYSNAASATAQGSGASDVVLWTAKAPTIVGQWQIVADATAAGGHRLQNPNAGAARVDPPAASPASYFELTFTAQAGQAYRLWMRGKATGDSWVNDSVWAQFDRSVTAQGTAAYRIGSTSAARLALQPTDGATLSGWGWEDNGFNGAGAPIYFSASGTQRLRIQVREDGLGIDQIVLSPVAYFTAAPGAPTNDNTVLPESGGASPPQGQEVVVWAAKAPTIVGQWQIVADATAAGGQRLQNPNAGAARVDPPAAAPASYFEVTFTAQAGRAYRLWMRGKATGNSWVNDSVWAQFDRSVTAQGAAVYRIGSTSATRLALQPTDGATLSGWGWEDNGFNGTGPSIYFSAGGTQRLRIQVREDGLGIDQIVLSAATYLNAAPGAARNDSTVLSEKSGQ